MLMPQVINFFTALAWPKNLAGDLSFFLLFVGVSLALGFVLGRWKLISILINVYIALAFVGVLPANLFTVSPYAKAASFILLLILLTGIDRRLFDIHLSNYGSDFFWRLFVMSLLVTGMVVSVTLSLLSKSVALKLISAAAYGYFASPSALVFWMVVPLLSLLFINNRLK